MNVVNGALALAVRVWDVTPHDAQVAAASDWAKFTHNIGSFITTLQDKINAAAKVS